MKRSASAFAAVFWMLLAALPAAAQPLQVFVSIAPQKYFAEKVGAGRVAVSVLVPPQADPHTFEPRPKQMTGLSRAALYFAVGVDFEGAWLDKIKATNPGLRVVHTDEGVPKIPIAGHRQAPPRSGHAHAENALDPHIWLAPGLVKLQAARMAEALAELDPVNRARYEANLAAFLGEVDGLDSELQALFAERRGARFMVFHPSWGYFAKHFGLEQVPVEIEGKDPKPAQLRELIRGARQAGIRVIFVQPQRSAKSAELIAGEIDGRVVVADPLAEDWATNLRAVSARFREALK